MASMSTVKVSSPCMLTNVPQKLFSSSTLKFPVSLGSVANASRTYGLKTSHSSGAFAEAAYKIKLVGPNGEENEFEAPSDQYILDAAETAGVDLPYSCRAGACSTCAGKIVSGTVDQSDGSFLDDNQLKEGYLLTCVSYPTSDLVIQTYKEADFY